MADSTTPNAPYAWKPSDVTTFGQQAQNLGQQAGNAGIQNALIGVQGQTGQADIAAGQSGQNVAAGANQVATGAQVAPTMAQAQGPQVAGGVQPTIQPAAYSTTAQAPAAPSTSIQTSTSLPAVNTTFNSQTQAYLQNLFPNGIPSSIVSSLQDATSAIIPNPNEQVNQLTGNSLTNTFGDYLGNVQNTISNPTNIANFQSYLQNQLAQQQQGLNQQYQTQIGQLAGENTANQANISNYTAGLNTNLQDYATKNKDLSNVGQQSAAEQQSAARNAVLTGQGAMTGPTAGTEALGAATANGVANSKLGVLSQQAQSEALQNAQAQAGVAQNTANIGQQQLTSGQTAQANALSNAGTAINANNTNLLNQLQQNNTKAQSDLTNAYNNSNTNLNKQEQDYVNNAQQTLQQAQVPESAIANGVSAFASTIQNALAQNPIESAQDQANLISNLEAIWRISVGSNPSDINFSDQIASILNPLVRQIKDFQLTNPSSPKLPPNTTVAALNPDGSVNQSNPNGGK